MPEAAPTDAGSQPADPERAIRCPWCKAHIGIRCTTRRGRALTAPVHQARLDAWTASQPADDTA